jgi:hypothetical protein
MIAPADIYGWQGWRMTSGDLVLGLVPQLGGRIMSLRFRGEELFYIPPTGRGDLPLVPASIPDLPAFKKDFGFQIFGGDKTWVAPEYAWVHRSPPLDLDAGVYLFEQTEDGCVMRSPVCRETGLVIVRKIDILKDGGISLIETLRNVSERVVTKGVWNVTQIARPFVVHLPADPGAIRSYHYEDPTLPDTGELLICKDGQTVVPCVSDMCFKFGGMLREGRAAVIKETLSGKVILERTFDMATGRPYAHNSMVEVFNSAQYPYGELEVHSPLTELAPGAEVSLAQTWRVYPA